MKILYISPENTVGTLSLWKQAHEARGNKCDFVTLYKTRHSFDPGYCLDLPLITTKSLYLNFRQKYYQLHQGKKGNYEEKMCPACRKIKDNYPMGLVFISGNFIDKHKDDILSTVKSEERRAIDKNPLERIMDINRENKNHYRIETTTDTLAQRIGKILHNSYKGEIEYKFSEGQKVLQVFWSRES